MVRAPACSSIWATLSAVRATGSSRSAGTICRMVAPASVRGGMRGWVMRSVMRSFEPAKALNLYEQARTKERSHLKFRTPCGETQVDRRPDGRRDPALRLGHERRLLPEIDPGWNRVKC